MHEPALVVADAELGDEVEGEGANRGDPRERRRDERHDEVPDARHPSLLRAHGGEESIGALQDLLPDRPALAVVRVEERRRSAARDHERELPGQVRRVLEAGVHALSARGAVDVGGVPGDEHAAVAIAVDAAVVQAITRHPARIVERDWELRDPGERGRDLVESRRREPTTSFETAPSS